MSALPLGVLSTRSHREPPVGATWRWLAIGAVILATLVSSKIAWSAAGPAFPFDEIDQLQMSRLLAGFELSEVRGAGYYPAWSFLLAPLWWVTSDPLIVYRCAIIIGLALGLVAIIPLAFIARRFRLTAWQSVFAAAVVVTLPAIAIQADYVLSERLLFLTVTLTVLTAWRLWERPSILRAIVFSLVVGLMLFTHVRVVAAVLACVIWLLLFALRNWRAALAGILSLAVFAFAAQHVSVDLNVQLLGHFAQGESLGDTVEKTRIGLLLRSGFGQAWTQIVGTLGLAAVGLVALGAWSWRELRSFRAGRATFVLAITLAMYLLTTIKWASDYHLFTRPWHRLDTWLYGRYIDPFVSLLVLLGLALIIRGTRRWVLIVAGAVSLAIILPTVLWVALDAPTWAHVTPAHIPGITPWHMLLPDEVFAEGTRLVPSLWNANRFWVYASLTTVIAMVLMYLLRRCHKTLAVGIALSAAMMSMIGDGASDEFRAAEYTPPVALAPLLTALDRTDSPATVQYDKGCNPDGAYESITINYYGYWLTPSVVTTYDSHAEVPTADLVIVCDGFVPEGRDDATPLPGSEYRETTIWVSEGAVADELRKLGALS